MNHLVELIGNLFSVYIFAGCLLNITYHRGKIRNKVMETMVQNPQASPFMIGFAVATEAIFCWPWF